MAAHRNRLRVRVVLRYESCARYVSESEARIMIAENAEARRAGRGYAPLGKRAPCV